jgi:predicted nucleotidyltransferase
MRLTPNELVAGVPARQLRDLFRYCHTSVSLELIAERLCVPKPKAAEVLKNLIAEGLVEDGDKGGHDLTTKAGAVANARFLKPIPRARADELVKELVARCREANANSAFTHYVRRMHVFGSYNRDTPDLGDVDIIIETAKRPGIGSVIEASEERARVAGRDMSRWDNRYYGQSEVKRFVKGSSRYLATHSLDDLEMEGVKVLFEADPADVRHATRQSEK